MPKRYRLDKLEMPDILAMEPKLRARVMRQGVKIIAIEARENAPVRSGKLKKAITYSVSRGGVEGKVKATKTKAPHAHLVHDGTKGHIIKAKTSESARRGWRFYRGSVHKELWHPGAKPNPFLLDAAEETRAEVERVMAKTAQDVLAEVAEGR